MDTALYTINIIIIKQFRDFVSRSTQIDTTLGAL